MSDEQTRPWRQTLPEVRAPASRGSLVAAARSASVPFVRADRAPPR